jgi:hypothetical protein
VRTAISGVIALGLLSAPGTAHAGRTFYGWLYGTEVLPERGVEITNTIDEENGREPNDIHWTTWGFSAEVGVTDQLTIAFPMDFVWRYNSVAAAPSFSFDQFGIEARYRLVSSDPVDAPPFAPLLRVGLKRDVLVRDTTIAEADLVASTTTQSGSVHALVDVGFVGRFFGDVTHTELRPGAGVSFKVAGDLRLGVEGYAELSLDDKKKSWAVVGPNIAWTHGRMWVSAAFGIGVYQIETAPRALWGIMF